MIMIIMYMYMYMYVTGIGHLLEVGKQNTFNTCFFLHYIMFQA